MYRIWGLIAIFLIVVGCKTAKMPGSQFSSKGFSWDNATVYFMLTDRFYNGDKSNDFQTPKRCTTRSAKGLYGWRCERHYPKIKKDILIH